MIGDARVILATSGSLVALSVLFMADRWRSDQLVYGRYNAVAVLPVIVVGIGALIGSPPVRRLATVIVAVSTVTVATAALLWALRRDLLESDNGLEPMILGLQPFVTSATSIDVPAITLISLLAATVVALVAVFVRPASRRTLTVLVLLSLIVVVGSLRTHDRIESTWNPARSTRSIEVLRGDVLTDGTAVDFFLPAGSNSTMAMMMYQFHLPTTPFAVVTDPLAGAPGTFVFAPDDDELLPRSGARIVWRDPHRPVALWQRPR